jgi:radical SAM superfamily enzyme YgiQ (UPF0313 family)
MCDVVLFNDIPLKTQLSRGIGAYRLSTELKNCGYSTFVIDYASFMTLEQFDSVVSRVVNNKTKVFGVSSTWFKNKTFSAKNIRSILDKYSSCYKLIVGGAYSYEYIQEDYDHVFIGHSENQIIDFCKGINSGIDFPRIIDYDRKAQEGNFNFNSSSTSFSFLHPDEIIGLETSRGCIFNCVFCSYPHRNQKTRNHMKCEETLYTELLNNYMKWGTTRYAIIDDTFNDYTDKLVRIKNVVNRLPFQPEFWAYIRFDLIEAHPEQAQLLYDIGLRSAMHGFETWNDETSKIIRKGDRKKKIAGMKIAKEIWKDDVFINIFYITGLPKDKIEDVYDFILYWKSEGKEYIDNVTAFPLYLRDLKETHQFYAEQSDIEKYKDFYGYKMTGPKSWVRKDSGINTFEIAGETANLINKNCKWLKKNTAWSWHPYADRLNIEDLEQATRKFFEEEYYPNLLMAANEL